jgi:2-polyprenyl-3-methyl-5-hydroxy-6-metoxy-1,4-benzoquinol methylase
MDLRQADLQLAAARHLRWMPALVQITPTEIVIDGWALSVWENPDQMRFLINGVDFDEVTWMPSVDLRGHFSAVPNIARARFRCRHRMKPGWEAFPGGFARFNVTSHYGEHRRSYRTAWFIADPALETQMPLPAQISRINTTDDTMVFRLGGATIVNRVEQLLQDRFERSLGSFEAILDWGCGAGRVTRYLTRFSTAVTGIDIDPDNIVGCQQALPMARFHQVATVPPTQLPDAAFDLVLGMSVLTHLKETAQFEWLAELQRITRPGALLLLSVQGLAQSALYQTPVEMVLATHAQGFYYVGHNSQLADVIAEPEYYSNVIQSPDYIQTRWGEYFDVLEIVEAIAGNQDLVILRRR